MAAARGEVNTSSVTGVVTDPSGAVIPDAVVTLTPAAPNGAQPVSTRTDLVGRYDLEAPPGEYLLQFEAPGFEAARTPLHVGSSPAIGSPATLARVPIRRDMRMKIAVQVQQMDVSADPSSSRSPAALVLSRADLSTMPLDSVALLEELQSLAGGPNAALFVDGFSGLTLPPLSQIREVRINQNPYSAQNDTNPVNGTIQVLTRPSTDRLHGEAYVDANSSALDARNPLVPGQPPFYTLSAGGLLSGSLRPGAAYVVGYDQVRNSTNALVSPQSLAQSVTPSPAAVPNPLSNITFSPRLDLQPAPRSTLNLGYTLLRTHQQNGGVGQLALASQAFDNVLLSQIGQLSWSQQLNDRAVNDVRMQYLRQRTSQTPVSYAPAVIVEGALNTGGNDLGAFSDHQDHVELQDNTTLTAGAHVLQFGGRVRIARDANLSRANFNGEYIFANVPDYQRTQQGQAEAASQFNLTAGNPSASITLADAGLYLEDDWRMAPNLTFSYGLRFETENFIPDHADWAPRIAVSQGFGRKNPSSPPLYTVRLGAGVFYQRFALASALNAVRQNGINEQEYVVTDPDFYGTAPPVSMLGSQSAPTIYAVSPRYRSPYFMGSTLGLERRLGHAGGVRLSWLENRGVHTQLIENVNAPLPGTYNPADPSSGVRPRGGDANLYHYASDGVFRSNRLSALLNLRTPRYALYTYYILIYDRSDAEAGSFPSEPYDIGADYGRANDDTHQTITVRGEANLAHGLWTSGYVHTHSGAPFDIVLGQDLNGDTIFNDRPAFATDLTRPTVVVTRWGTFDTNPQPGQKIIPRNLGQGPALVIVTTAVGETIALHPQHATAGAPSPASLEFWVESQNLLNHPNYGPPVGTLGSPLFGQSVALVGVSTASPDRTVDFHFAARF